MVKNSASGPTRNEDVQASQQLLQLLEHSTSRSEEIFDHLPGIHAVIEESGRILRGNHELARWLGASCDELPGRNLGAAFGAGRWGEFLEKSGIGSAGGVATQEFELAVGDGERGEGTPFLWQAVPFDAGVPRRSRLYSISGRNIGDYKRTLEELLAAKKDLELASAVQGLLLPKIHAFSNESIVAESFYRPASTVGGDWWWHEAGPDGSSFIFVADVLGHGAGAAMLTALIAGSCRTVGLLSARGSADPAASTFFEVFHRTVRDFCGGEHWIAVTLVEILPREDRVKVWNTGGPPVLRLGADGTCQALLKSGTPVGSDDPVQVSELSHAFAPGDRLLLYTDGMYDFEIPPGERQGYARLKGGLVATHGRDIRHAREMLVADFDRSTAGKPQRDDAAFVVVDRRMR